MHETGEDDIWQGYDRERVKPTLRISTACLCGVDRAELLRDLHNACKQSGRVYRTHKEERAHKKRAHKEMANNKELLP